MRTIALVSRSSDIATLILANEGLAWDEMIEAPAGMLWCHLGRAVACLWGDGMRLTILEESDVTTLPSCSCVSELFYRRSTQGYVCLACSKEALHEIT